MPIHTRPSAKKNSQQSRRISKAGLWIGGGVLTILAWMSTTQPYLLFHSCTEVISATVLFLVAAVGWHAFPLTRNVFFLILGSGFFWVGVFTLLHAFSYPGVDIFGADVPHLSIRLCLVMRLFEAIVLVVAIRFSTKSSVPSYVHLSFALLFVVLVFTTFQPWFPEVFHEDSGLTSFKIVAEYGTLAVFVLALTSLRHLEGRVDELSIRRLSFAVGFIIFSQLPFTLYRSHGDFASILGHILTLFAYWFLFMAAVQITLRQPLRAMRAEAYTYEAFPDATVVVDQEGKILQANGAARRESGLENCVGCSCHGIFHPMALAQEDCPICQHIKQGMPVQTLEIQDSKYDRWYHFCLSLVGEKEMIHVRRDVSELKRAESAVRESELRYRALMTYATDAILVVDETGRFADANRKAEQLFGCSRSELLKLKPADIRLSGETDTLEHAFNHMAVHGSVLREHRVVREGNTRFVELAGARVVLEKNVLYLGIFRDVTARREAENALRENEALLRQAEEIVRMGSWDKNLVTGEIRWSEGMHRILCTRSISPSMQQLLDAIPECERGMVEELIGHALSNGDAFRIDHRLNTFNGEELRVRTLGRAQCDAVGRPLRLFGTLVDVTEAERIAEELKTYREELERLVTERTAKLLRVIRELESFSYTVSHDLNAPLRAINGFSCALIDDCGAHLPPEGRDYLDRIINATHRMGLLIDGLLMLSWVSRHEVQYQDCDLTSMARDIFSRLRVDGGTRNVQFHVRDGITATGDPALLRLLLENLIGNAWKFTGCCESAVIEFDAIQLPDETVFLVRDNGIGFEMQYAETLFRPFHRLHGWDEYEGVGIGLAMVQRIVQQHGGRIWAESTPGHGTVIYFTLGCRRSSTNI